MKFIKSEGFRFIFAVLNRNVSNKGPSMLFKNFFPAFFRRDSCAFEGGQRKCKSGNSVAVRELDQYEEHSIIIFKTCCILCLLEN